MSQRRGNVIEFQPLKPSATDTRLPSKASRMLRVDLSRSQPLLSRLARLQELRPDVAAVIGKLVDDLLAEVS